MTNALSTSAGRLPERVVVAGFGMAGSRLVDEILARRADGRAVRPVAVTVAGDEPHPAYNRVLLTDAIGGHADLDALQLCDPAGYASRGAAVRLGTGITRVELPPSGPGVAHLGNGDRLVFDRLVLATGAEPVVPPLAGTDPGAPPVGLHTLRTVDDARGIISGCARTRRAVVLGGGLLGLETARALARRGLDVQVLDVGPHLLPNVLGAEGGAVLARALLRLGVRTRAGVTVRGLATVRDRLTGVEIDDGRGSTELVPADLLVVACGVRARVGLARQAGLAVRRGVVVDDALATSDPRVLAVGDCAEHRGAVPGLVAPAWEQARIAADLLTGADPDARYAGHRPAVRLKVAELEVATAGETGPGVWDEEPGMDVVQFVEPGAGRYLKVVVRDGIVTGAVVVGDARAAADLRLLVDRGTAAPADLATLLVPGTRLGAAAARDPMALSGPETVCRCNGVTRNALVDAWTTGARDRAGLARATRATTGCGTCTGAVEGIASWLAARSAGGGAAFVG